MPARPCGWRGGWFGECFRGEATGPCAFTVTVGGQKRAVRAVSVDRNAVTLSLTSQVAFGQTAITVGYARPDAGTRLAGANGDAVASFSGEAVANHTPRPDGPQVTRVGEAIRMCVTFSAAVTVAGHPHLTIDMDPADWGAKRAT